jgi:hypothetical protein
MRFRKKNSELNVFSKYISAYNALPLKIAKKQTALVMLPLKSQEGGRKKAEVRL